MSSDLHTEREHWYRELSGGQQSKAALTAHLFSRETCPKVPGLQGFGNAAGWVSCLHAWGGNSEFEYSVPHAHWPRCPQ